MTDRQPLSPEPYKGVHDYYPETWSQVTQAMQTIRTALRTRGFAEYQASPLERAELYEAKTSEEIVQQQTYTFEDRGGRRVTLRPEMTPTLARMVAARRRELVFPIRWFSIGNRFRYERPQRGRSREFYQADVDIVGFSGNDAETEAIITAFTILRAFGATPDDFRIRINSRRLINAAGTALGLSAAEVTDFLALLDRKNKMPAEEFAAAREAFRRNGTDPLELIASGSDATVAAAYAELQALIDTLHARGVTNAELDLSIARGFLYYTGIVFEVFDTNPENPRALLGGGRYDDLVSLFGVEPVTAVGFAIGLETLMDFLHTHNLAPDAEPPATILIGTPTPADIPAAEAYAETLRATGIPVLVHTGDKALGDQVKEAVRRGIPYFGAYGEHEHTSGEMKVKELATGTETTVSLSSLAAFIRP